METESATPTQDKQVTVAVPEDRVAEFYASYARFLAGHIRRGRRGRHGCGPRRHEERGEGPAEPTIGEA